MSDLVDDVSALVDDVSRLVGARAAVWRCLELSRAVGLREPWSKNCKRLSIISGPNLRFPSFRFPCRLAVRRRRRRAAENAVEACPSVLVTS